MTDSQARWESAMLALACLAADPSGLRGMVIRARPGPVRDRYLAQLATLPLLRRQMHPGISDEQLFGGVDIAATLSLGRVVTQAGLLQTPAAWVLTMAERCSSDLAARLAQHLDGLTEGCLILIDEGAEVDERAPAALQERLAFFVDLEGLSVHDIEAVSSLASRPEPAAADETSIAALVAAAFRLGIDSLRAPQLALTCAKAHARLHDRGVVGADDLNAAAALALASRATRLPEEEPADEDETPTDPPPEQEEQQDAEGDTQEPLITGDMLVDAVKAVLPPDLLDRMKAGRSVSAASGSGAGQKRKGNRRGRPLPPRPGRLDGRRRIDLVATLRAAAPWQPLRRRQQPEAPGLLIRAADIRLKRFEDRSDRLLIFTVDASGSAAVSRLNEAKGAVEMLLAEAYARRDHVALISFRGVGAEILLPPTRSLVQTKRRLAALPGGGGTPLAAGLKQAAELADLSRSKGLTPTIVIMTDGRANIALDGSADRPQAAADAKTLAGSLRARGVPALMIDMSNRPQPVLRELASTFDATYLPLPRADAGRVSAAVTASIGD